MYILEDYLDFRGDLDFAVSPVNEIDEMIFASMGKADYTGILAESGKGKYSVIFSIYFALHHEKEDENLGLLESPILMKILHKIYQCKRYSDIQICNFVNRISSVDTEQMSALTVIGPNGKIYVTYRGTDDTLVGWKENCELAIKNSVPAQRDATEYLEKIATEFDGPIIVSGHSKGGNLAVYAASEADETVQSRIEKVISYDGPGFMQDFLDKQGYQRVKDRIVTMVPKTSFVGMLMEHAGTLDVIECENDGIGAHDIFYWNLNKEGFLRAGAISDKSRIFHQAMEQTLNNMNLEERQETVDEIFEVLSSTGAVNLLDLSENSVSQALKLSSEFQKSKEIRQFLLSLSKFSIKGAVNSTIEDLQEKIQDIVTNIPGKK